MTWRRRGVKKRWGSRALHAAEESDYDGFHILLACGGGTAAGLGSDMREWRSSQTLKGEDEIVHLKQNGLSGVRMHKPRRVAERVLENEMK